MVDRIACAIVVVVVCNILYNLCWLLSECYTKTNNRSVSKFCPRVAPLIHIQNVCVRNVEHGLSLFHLTRSPGFHDPRYLLCVCVCAHTARATSFVYRNCARAMRAAHPPVSTRPMVEHRATAYTLESCLLFKRN